MTSGIARAVDWAGSQAKLAALAGVPVSTLGRWTQVGRVSRRSAPRIAAITGIALADLLGTATTFGRVVLAIEGSGRTMPDIVARTGQPEQTVRRAVAALVEDGVLTKHELPSGFGRPAYLYCFAQPEGKTSGQSRD